MNTAQAIMTLTLLPGGQEEQVRTHEAKLKAMANELREHRATQLGKKARGKEADEQRQKEAYLEFEVSPLPDTHTGSGWAQTAWSHWMTSGRVLL